MNNAATIHEAQAGYDAQHDEAAAA